MRIPFPLVVFYHVILAVNLGLYYWAQRLYQVRKTRKILAVMLMSGCTASGTLAWILYMHLHV